MMHTVSAKLISKHYTISSYKSAS